MRFYKGSSANDVWKQATSELIEGNVDFCQPGRGGTCRELLQTALLIDAPCNRWVTSRKPHMNPAFALVEVFWILAGSSQSKVPNFWNRALPRFQGEGSTYYGAYGHRLKRNLGFDQIKRAYEALAANGDSRQVVLQIWDGRKDLPDENGRPRDPDIPCNLVSLLKVRKNRLYWTQIMRSNDIMLGLPHNFVQFTMLQEMMAGWLGCDLGQYMHVSDSLHLYEHDAHTYAIDPEDDIAISTTSSFRMGFAQSEVLFGAIYSDLEKVAAKSCSTEELKGIFMPDSNTNRNRPSCIRDSLAVIGCDAARRYNNLSLATELEQACGCPQLRHMARRWREERPDPDGGKKGDGSGRTAS